MNEKHATKLLRAEDDCMMVNNRTDTELASLIEAQRKLAVLERVTRELIAVIETNLRDMPMPAHKRVQQAVDAAKAKVAA